MNNKLTSSTAKLNAIFLAIVLVTGTIAVISSSFIIKGVNAQTEPYYEKDTRYSNYEQEPEHMDKGYSAYEPDYPKYPNDKKYNNYGLDSSPKYTDDRKYNSYESDHYGMDNDRKLYKKDVSVQSLKCNNINVNFNGLELNVLPQFFGGDEIVTEATEGQSDVSSFANNGDGSQINDFRFICINTNNNTVIEAEEPVQPTSPEPPVITLYVVNQADNTVEIYDINNPTAPVRIGEFGAGDLNVPRGIAIQGTILYVTNAIDNTVEIYDINNPTAPEHVGEFGAGELNGPQGIAIQGTTLYVANEGDGTVEIYDINNPTAPEHVGEFGAGDLSNPFGIAIQVTTP